MSTFSIFIYFNLLGEILMCWTCQLPTRCWYGEGQTQTGASPTPHYLQNPTRTWQQVWAPSSGQVRRHIENWTWLSGHWDCYSWWWRWGEDVSDGNGYWQFWYIWAEGIGVGNALRAISTMTWLKGSRQRGWRPSRLPSSPCWEDRSSSGLRQF